MYNRKIGLNFKDIRIVHIKLNVNERAVIKGENKTYKDSKI